MTGAQSHRSGGSSLQPVPAAARVSRLPPARHRRWPCRWFKASSPRRAARPRTRRTPCSSRRRAGQRLRPRLRRAVLRSWSTARRRRSPVRTPRASRAD